MSDPAGKAWAWRHVGCVVFRCTPYAAFGFRRRWLRLFGAKLGATTKVRRSVSIDRPWNLTAGEKTAFGDGAMVRARAPVTVGSRCTVSQLAIISTEAIDASDPSKSIVAPITIEDDGWVAADALVMPGVTVRAGAVLGARGVAEGDVEAWMISVGQPAKAVKARRFVEREG